MKKQIISLLIIIFSLTSFQTHALEQNWKPAQVGDKIILIRHAKAPGGGDPEGFKIDDCKTQRNLDMMGINQAKKIGKLFREKKLKLIKFYQASGVGAKILQNMLLAISKNFLR